MKNSIQIKEWKKVIAIYLAKTMEKHSLLIDNKRVNLLEVRLTKIL